METPVVTTTENITMDNTVSSVETTTVENIPMDSTVSSQHIIMNNDKELSPVASVRDIESDLELKENNKLDSVPSDDNLMSSSDLVWKAPEIDQQPNVDYSDISENSMLVNSTTQLINDIDLEIDSSENHAYSGIEADSNDVLAENVSSESGTVHELVNDSVAEPTGNDEHSLTEHVDFVIEHAQSSDDIANTRIETTDCVSSEPDQHVQTIVDDVEQTSNQVDQVDSVMEEIRALTEPTESAITHEPIVDSATDPLDHSDLITEPQHLDNQPIEIDDLSNEEFKNEQKLESTEEPVATNADFVEDSPSVPSENKPEVIDIIEMSDDDEPLITSNSTEPNPKVIEPDSSNQAADNVIESIDCDDSNEVTEIKTSETIEITEMRSDDMSVTDIAHEVEYTVIEADDAEVITSNDAASNEETVVFVKDDDVEAADNSERYVEEILLEHVDDDCETVQEEPELVEGVTESVQGENESVQEQFEDDLEMLHEETAPAPPVVKEKKPRGRKPVGDIPLHVMGRFLNKPQERVSNGNRNLPKPRLGVKVSPKGLYKTIPRIHDTLWLSLANGVGKVTLRVETAGVVRRNFLSEARVPCRNLTSQIVSKAEIQKEIIDRFKQKQEQNTVSPGDFLFARKLTQRLAKKLTANDDANVLKAENVEHAAEEQTSDLNEQSAAKSTSTPIQNNSDLIAILEGNDEDLGLVTVVEPKTPAVPEKNVKDIEREIAMKQLKELPLLSSKNRIFKSRGQQPSENIKSVAPATLSQLPIKVQKSTTPAHPVAAAPVKSAESSPSKPAKLRSDSPTATKTVHKAHSEKKSHVDVEPRLKTGMVIKTYTRKRRSFELESILPRKKLILKESSKGDENISRRGVYVTKSSRVIKKKVIWDPDEIPTRTFIKSPKPADSISKTKQPEASAKIKSADSASDFKAPPKVKSTVDKAENKNQAAAKKVTPVKKLKRLSEIDKLLMDEGAVNMLYEVKNNEEKTKKKNKNVISLDRAHKELMSKTNSVKNDLQQNTNKEPQKSLRKKDLISPKKDAAVISPATSTTAKKESAPIQRKKSKDSLIGSGNSPPASPAYAYSAAEASRIIRRHSSSSFSSDLDEENGDGERVTRKRSSATGMEPPKKKVKKVAEVKSKDAAKNNNNSLKDTTKYNTFTITKRNKLVSIELNYADGQCYLTEEVLRELIACLKDLAKDDNCNVTSITADASDKSPFCRGLDYRTLISDDPELCKKKSTELAALVKEFLQCLLNFPKVLVAGIQGDCVGLGVTMLPLFDMVIASDTSTFSTPYANLGCAPEGGFLLTVPYLSRHGLASELLYTSQVLKADDAFRRGLITRLCWPEKYHEEFKSILTGIASQSRQSIEATKQQLRQHLVKSTEALLSSTAKVLAEHWVSAECQQNFSQIKIED